MSKDIFSVQAEKYSKFRPVYPKELFDYILQFVDEKNIVWDCATGNGQAAFALADHFKKIFATDISEKQLVYAKQHENIVYKILPAEQTDFADNTFDLITVAQAYHWIKFNAFEKEAKRVAKNNAVIAVWCYNLLLTNDAKINELIKKFYFEITGPYWDAERKYVDENYNSVPFNFEALPTKDFSINIEWRKNDLIGYFNSWSSVQHYINANKKNPVDKIIEELNFLWKDEDVKAVTFPLFLRIGKIIK